MVARPHDPEVAEWMGLDPEIEGIVLATAEAEEREARRSPLTPRVLEEGFDSEPAHARRAGPTFLSWRDD